MCCIPWCTGHFAKTIVFRLLAVVRKWHVSHKCWTCPIGLKTNRKILEYSQVDADWRWHGGFAVSFDRRQLIEGSRRFWFLLRSCESTLATTRLLFCIINCVHRTVLCLLFFSSWKGTTICLCPRTLGMVMDPCWDTWKSIKSTSGKQLPQVPWITRHKIGFQYLIFSVFVEMLLDVWIRFHILHKVTESLDTPWHFLRTLVSSLQEMTFTQYQQDWFVNSTTPAWIDPTQQPFHKHKHGPSRQH